MGRDILLNRYIHLVVKVQEAGHIVFGKRDKYYDAVTIVGCIACDMHAYTKV